MFNDIEQATIFLVFYQYDNLFSFGNNIKIYELEEEEDVPVYSDITTLKIPRSSRKTKKS